MELVPTFHDRQVWDPRIRAYRRVSIDEVEQDRLRRMRQENQRRQQQHLARCPRAVLVS